MVNLLKEVQHVWENGPGAAAENMVQLQLERVLVPCLHKFAFQVNQWYIRETWTALINSLTSW